MRILLTGATGFLGAAVLEELVSARHSVIALTRRPSSSKLFNNPLVTPLIAAMDTPESVAASLKSGVDCVIHCAADRSADSLYIDRRFVEYLLPLMSATGARFIYTSGSWVYGDTPRESLITEKYPLQPLPFVEPRTVTENIVLEAAGNVTRPPLLFGLSGSLTSLWFTSLRDEGSVWIPGDGKNLLSMVHVTDAARFYRLLAESPIRGEIFNVSSKHYVSLIENAESVHHAFAIDVPVRKIPLLEARKRLGVIADGLAVSQTLDSEKATSLLGWDALCPPFSTETSRYAREWEAAGSPHLL